MSVRRIVLFLLLLLTAACEVQQPPEAAAPPVPSAAAGEGFVPGMLTLQFDDQMLSLIEEDLASGGLPTKAPALGGLVEDLGIVHIERVGPHAG
jgi:hypothetical protein